MMATCKPHPAMLGTMTESFADCRWFLSVGHLPYLSGHYQPVTSWPPHTHPYAYPPTTLQPTPSQPPLGLLYRAFLDGRILLVPGEGSACRCQAKAEHGGSAHGGTNGRRVPCLRHRTHSWLLSPRLPAVVFQASADHAELLGMWCPRWVCQRGLHPLCALVRPCD